MRASEIFETKMFFSAHPSWAGQQGQIFENPSLTSLSSLGLRMELRGIGDGKNIFVWDARKMIHGAAVYAIAASGRWRGDFRNEEWHMSKYGFAEPKYDLDLSFYVFSQDKNTLTSPDGAEWASSRNVRHMGIDHYQIAPNLTVAVVARGLDKLLEIPAFKRIFKNAELISQGRK